MNEAIPRNIEWVGQAPSGFTLGRYKNEMGGYCYITDEFGVVVYNTSLHSYADILFAIAEEFRRQAAESIGNQKKGKKQSSGKIVKHKNAPKGILDKYGCGQLSEEDVILTTTTPQDKKKDER